MGLVDNEQLDGQQQMPFARLSVEEARDRTRRYLNDSHATLWGRAFDLSQAESKTEAEGFIINLLKSLGVVQVTDRL